MTQRYKAYKDIVKTIHKALKEFGYTSLTFEEVLESYDRSISGEINRGNVVDLFVNDRLTEIMDVLEGGG